MRVALVLLGIAVLVYVAVRAVQRRRAVPPPRPAAPPPGPSPRAQEEYRRAVRERAERQRRGVPEPEPERQATTPVVVVEDEVFAHDHHRDISNEHFVVVSAATSEQVIAAVARANERFLLVDELGREHADHSALEAAFAAHAEGDLYTPNYAADPRVTDAGVEGYVDCKGGIEPAMGETMRRVLLEELARLGHPARASVPSRD